MAFSPTCGRKHRVHQPIIINLFNRSDHCPQKLGAMRRLARLPCKPRVHAAHQWRRQQACTHAGRQVDFENEKLAGEEQHQLTSCSTPGTCSRSIVVSIPFTFCSRRAVGPASVWLAWTGSEGACNN